jgi:hypothetical protein
MAGLPQISDRRQIETIPKTDPINYEYTMTMGLTPCYDEDRKRGIMWKRTERRGKRNES